MLGKVPVSTASSYESGKAFEQVCQDVAQDSNLVQ
jgi:transketolase C-terminal domain/subunit